MNYAVMGQRIKAKRKELHLTQEQLAELSGLSASFMGHIERGSRIASLETLCGLCRALDVSADYLLGLSEEAFIKPIIADLTREEIEAGVKLLQRMTGK